jgi:RNA polymerase sigma-70 factor (ECF subfamily)
LISDEPLGLRPVTTDGGDIDAREEGGALGVETDEARVRRMVEAHFDALWRFVRRLGVAEADVEDAVQEVIVIAASRLPEIARSREQSFLFGTAYRIASDQRRWREARREVDAEALDDRQDPGPEPDAVADRTRARALLDHVLAGMPTDVRAVFALAEIEGLTMAEIAELLEVPPGTVASRLRRGREHFQAQVERLKARMKREGRGGAPDPDVRKRKAP